MTLAQQLEALCIEHDMNHLSVTISRREDGSVYFGAYAHKGGICGTASLRRETPHSAVSEAIADLQQKLGIGVELVPELEAAA